MKKAIIFIAVLMLLGLILIGGSCGGDKKSSDYTIYTNTEYGFSFEYPKAWYIEDSSEFGNIFLSSKEEEAPMGGVSLGARIEIFIMENTENFNLDQWIRWMKGYEEGELYGKMLETEEITVGGERAIKEKGVAPSGPVEQGPPITVYLAKDNYIIQMSYTGREPDYTENLKNLEHLLDSFKFEKDQAQLEKEQMFEAAREYIKKYSIEGAEFELRIIKQLDKWALLEAVPINFETDNVGVIMEKVEGKWVCRTFGTILPGWEEKVPELFEL